MSDSLVEWLRGLIGQPTEPPVTSVDEVNSPMIRHWCEAMGDANALYPDRGLAPPAMIQAWFLPPLGTVRPPPGSLYNDVLVRLRSRGFTSVVATDIEQEHLRYARVGERLVMETRIAEVSERKTTRLGEGYFITTRSDISAMEGDGVCRLGYRRLYFAPRGRS